MHSTLKNIVEGKTVEVPTYDFVTHSRWVLLCLQRWLCGAVPSLGTDHSAVARGLFNSVLWVLSPGRLAETTVVYPADVVLFEGILVFYNQDIRDMFHLRLFVDTDSDVRLSRRGEALLCPCSLSIPTMAQHSGLLSPHPSSARYETWEGPGADPHPVHHVCQACL